MVAINPNLDCIYANLYDFLHLGLYQDCAVQDASVDASVLVILITLKTLSKIQKISAGQKVALYE